MFNNYGRHVSRDDDDDDDDDFGAVYVTTCGRDLWRAHGRVREREASNGRTGGVCHSNEDIPAGAHRGTCSLYR